MAAWTEVRTRMLGLPIDIVPADQDSAELAGEFKATRKKSLANCLCATLAKQRRAEVHTGDLELRAVDKEFKIVWV